MTNQDSAFTTVHPADAKDESQLTYGQRLTRRLFPHYAALQDQRLCIRCHQPQEDQSSWTEAGRREWRITGCCEPCFDAMYAPPPLSALVAELLDIAVENDNPEVRDRPALDIAVEMVNESVEVEDYLPVDLVPHILAWQKAQQP